MIERIPQMLTIIVIIIIIKQANNSYLVSLIFFYYQMEISLFIVLNISINRYIFTFKSTL